MTFWIVAGICIGLVILLDIGYRILKARKEAMEETLRQKTGDWWTCNLLGTKCRYIPFDKIRVEEDEKA